MTEGKAASNVRSIGINFVAGAVVGFGVVTLFARFFPAMEAQGLHMPALLIGLMLLAMGLYILAAAASPALARRIITPSAEPGDDLAEERRLFALQGIVSALAAMELAVLALPPTFLTGPAMPALLAGLAILLAVQTWLNVRLWRSGDEFFRRIIVDAVLISAVAFQFVLFLWAVGSRFALLPEPTSFDVYVALMAFYLVGSGIAGMRSGY